MSPVPPTSSVSLPLAVHRTSAEYVVMWDQMEEVIVPKVMYGSSLYLHLSKMCEFKPGQDWVGKLYSNSPGQVTVLWDSLLVDPLAFHRKHAAVINGISSIIFMKARDGSLVELGFRSCNEAEAALSQLNGLDSDSISTSGSDLSDTDSTSAVSDSSRRSRRAWTDDDVPVFRKSSNIMSDAKIPDIECDWKFGGSWPSVGSKGHPYFCGQVCKFAWRQRGCKDGQNCTHCHICRYTRKAARTQKKLTEDFSKCNSSCTEETCKRIGSHV